MSAHGGAEVMTSTGWAVRFDTARMIVGALRWYEGAPLFGARTVSPWRWVRGVLGPSVAWAHPGHYVPGEALADVVGPTVIDLIGADGTGTSMGWVDGVTGTPMSGHVVVQPMPTGQAQPQGFNNGSVWLEGTAMRAGETVRFVATPAITTTVEGIPARGVFDLTQRPWRVTVDLGAWVDRMDFSTLSVAPGADPSALRVVTIDSQPGNALYRGVTSAGSYGFESETVTDAGNH